MVTQNELSVKVFADGADLAGIRALVENPLIKGFTTTRGATIHVAGSLSANYWNGNRSAQFRLIDAAAA